MSRASRRMMKKQRRVAAEKGQGKAPGVTAAEREELRQLLESEQYAAYINRLAEAVQAGHYDGEILYQGAYSYFMLGDYLRAANMVNDVLTLVPGHIAARILLARICLLDDRTDDGLAIIDFVLEHYGRQISEEQREDFKDLLDYYADAEGEHILKDFPHVAAFLQEAGLLEEAGVEDSESMPTDVADDAAAGESTAADAAEADAFEDHGEADAVVDAAAEPTETKEAEHPADQSVAEAEIQRIMDQPVSLMEKVRLLNVFAAAHFAAGAAEYSAARMELAQACRLDATSQETLRNLAVLAKCEGRQEEAMTLASKLQQSDFLLLAFLMRA